MKTTYKIGSDSKTAAANIRTELRTAFPGVKFSVRMDGYSSIDITWTDGPTSKAVEALTAPYTLGSFDGMTDSYDYSRDEFNNLYGGVQYIFCRREHSQTALATAIAAVGEKYKLATTETATWADDYKKGTLYRFGPWGVCGIQESWAALICEALATN